MNLTWFYERFKDDLGTNFTSEDLIKCLKTLSAFQLFDIVCEVCLGFVEDAIGQVAERMIDLRDRDRYLERVLAQKQAEW